MIANLLDYVISNDSSTPTSMIDYLFDKDIRFELSCGCHAVRPTAISHTTLESLANVYSCLGLRRPGVVLLDSGRSCRNIDAASIS